MARPNQKEDAVIVDTSPIDEIDAGPDEDKGSEAATPCPGSIVPVAPGGGGNGALMPNVEAWWEARRRILAGVKAHLVEGTDWARLHVVGKEKCPRPWECTIKGHYSKPVLLKPGAEKVLGMLGLRVTFPALPSYEERAIEGKPIQQIVLRCLVHDGAGRIVSEGIGARSTSQDKGDLNKSLKMACKSSQVDAALRAGGLSEMFTQDLDSMDLSVHDPGPDEVALAADLRSGRKTRSEAAMEVLRPAAPKPDTQKPNTRKLTKPEAEAAAHFGGPAPNRTSPPKPAEEPARFSPRADGTITASRQLVLDEIMRQVMLLADHALEGGTPSPAEKRSLSKEIWESSCAEAGVPAGSRRSDLPTQRLQRITAILEERVSIALGAPAPGGDDVPF